jgi:hypothetical protein
MGGVSASPRFAFALGDARNKFLGNASISPGAKARFDSMPVCGTTEVVPFQNIHLFRDFL